MHVNIIKEQHPGFFNEKERLLFHPCDRQMCTTNTILFKFQFYTIDHAISNHQIVDQTGLMKSTFKNLAKFL